MYNTSDIGRILKSTSMHKKNNKGTMKSNFVVSCITFRGSIPTKLTIPYELTSQEKIVVY